MPMPEVTPQDVANYAPGAPAVTQGQVDQSKDWAELLFRKAGVTPPTDQSTLEGRELVRAISAHSLARLPGVSVLALASAADRVVKLKDSDGSEITFGGQTAADLAAAGVTLLGQAYRHLYGAGLPRVLFVPAVSR